MRVLAIALFTAVVAQASLVDRKRAGRDLQDGEDINADKKKPLSYEGGEPCGVLFAPPCKDLDGCAPGLILDAVGWSDLVGDGFLEGLVDGRRLDDATSDLQWERKLLEYVPPPGPPTCVPCGELGQLPCTPCEGECVPKCSEGLIATNIVGYDPTFTRRRLDGDPCMKDPSSCTEIPSNILAVNLCLPCGADGQPPCDDTGCLPGHVAKVSDGPYPIATCVECGGMSDPVCEDGHCNPELAATKNGKCVQCGEDGNPCCCNSNEYDEVYRSILYSNDKAYEDIEREILLASVIQSAGADPTKCLRGCNSPLRCGVDNVCYSNS